MEDTKQELLEIIKKYEHFYNKRIIEYLNYLINLESSVLKSEIQEYELELLMSSENFRNIVKYNIYYGTIKQYRDKAILKRMLDKLDVFRSFPDKYCGSSMTISLQGVEGLEGDYYELLKFVSTPEPNNKADRLDIIFHNTTTYNSFYDLISEFNEYFKNCNGINEQKEIDSDLSSGIKLVKSNKILNVYIGRDIK